LYHGKADTACNYVGGLAVAETLEWTHKQQFKDAPMESIQIGGAELGQQKSFGGLTFLQVGK
jgi:carboxypeptidase C (cathepsin A)